MFKEQEREQLIFKYHKLIVELSGHRDKLFHNEFDSAKTKLLEEIKRLKTKDNDNE